MATAPARPDDDVMPTTAFPAPPPSTVEGADMSWSRPPERTRLSRWWLALPVPGIVTAGAWLVYFLSEPGGGGYDSLAVMIAIFFGIAALGVSAVAGSIVGLAFGNRADRILGAVLLSLTAPFVVPWGLHLLVR